MLATWRNASGRGFKPNPDAAEAIRTGRAELAARTRSATPDDSRGREACSSGAATREASADKRRGTAENPFRGLGQMADIEIKQTCLRMAPRVMWKGVHTDETSMVCPLVVAAAAAASPGIATGVGPAGRQLCSDPSRRRPACEHD